MQTSGKKRGISIILINAAFVVIVFLFSVGVIMANGKIQSKYKGAVTAQQALIACSEAAGALQNKSDDLTLCINSYVDTGNTADMTEYFKIINTHMREKAISRAEAYNTDCSTLHAALKLSDELAAIELQSFALMNAALGTADTAPEQVKNYTLSIAENNLSAEEKIEKARGLIHGRQYNSYKRRIYKKIKSFENEALFKTEDKLTSETADVSRYLNYLYVIAAIAVLLVILTSVVLYRRVTVVLNRYICSISKNEYLNAAGTTELKYLANVFNACIDEINKEHTELKYHADIDPLTGAANRRVLEDFMHNIKTDGAFLFFDVDDFKNINDNYGHEIGDEILKNLVKEIRKIMRDNDFIGRFGGDEFAVWLDGLNASNTEFLKERIEGICGRVLLPDGTLVRATVSAGVTFCTAGEKYKDVLKRADTALYKAKHTGKNGCAVL